MAHAFSQNYSSNIRQLLLGDETLTGRVISGKILKKIVHLVTLNRIVSLVTNVGGFKKGLSNSVWLHYSTKELLAFSLTRWHSQFFNIWSFTTMKNCPIGINKLSKLVNFFAKFETNVKIARGVNNFDKATTFCQIWSHCSLLLFH